MSPIIIDKWHTKMTIHAELQVATYVIGVHQMYVTGVLNKNYYMTIRGDNVLQP